MTASENTAAAAKLDDAPYYSPLSSLARAILSKNKTLLAKTDGHNILFVPANEIPTRPELCDELSTRLKSFRLHESTVYDDEGYYCMFLCDENGAQQAFEAKEAHDGTMLDKYKLSLIFFPSNSMITRQKRKEIENKRRREE